MGDNFEQLSEDDLHEYGIAFEVIESIENNSNIKAELKNSFTTVRNYLANVIAHYAIDNL